MGRRDPCRRRHRQRPAFCVGADLRSWEDTLVGRPQEYWKWFGAFKDMHDRLREIGKPTIARINGIAVGGGNELQMACDLAVIVDDAFIRHVGLEHGSVPAGGATQWLQLMVGDRRAREIVLLCDEIPAPQAADWGLVNRAVPAAELDAVVDAWVESLVRKLPQTTRYAKHQLNVWRDMAWHQTVGHARDWLSLSMLGDEAQGAITSSTMYITPIFLWSVVVIHSRTVERRLAYVPACGAVVVATTRPPKRWPRCPS